MEPDEKRGAGCGLILLGSGVVLLAFVMPFLGLPLALLAAAVAIAATLARWRRGGS